jgi:hypothetical protein
MEYPGLSMQQQTRARQAHRHRHWLTAAIARDNGHDRMTASPSNYQLIPHDVGGRSRDTGQGKDQA